ncbi:MAG: cysteine desulfurase [Clostridia bacterium]|nr:cysteine desulfurase [Clostridia bacterium]
MVYLDNSATTKPYAEVSVLIAEQEQKNFANASALYRSAVAAEEGILQVKYAIASVLHCTPDEILLTSGGTYSNNLAVLGAAEARKRMGNRIVLSMVEHPSVYACGAVLQERGFDVVYAAPTAEAFEEAINEKTIVVAAMLVNNEVGSILPIAQIARIIKRKKAPAHFHVDGVQAFCKIPCNVSTLKCDSFSISAHKLKGPKGIGALYLKKGVRVKNITVGGEQEKGIVPGTYNSPAAFGFAKAIQLYQKEDLGHLEQLRAHFLERAKKLPFVQINSSPEGVPYILNISCIGYLGENILHYLEEQEIYVSQGSACSSKKARSQSVLARLGMNEQSVMGALRISFGIDTTVDEIDALMDALEAVPQKIQKMYR